MAEFTSDERLAFCVALDKRLNNRKDGILTTLKEDSRAELMASFAEMGADRKAIIANGEKVGDVSLSYSTAKPCILADRQQAALDYLEQLGMVERVPKKGWESLFASDGDEVVCTETGEVVDWATWQPSGVRCATVRGCDPDKVVKALKGKLASGAAVVGLLGGE